MNFKKSFGKFALLMIILAVVVVIEFCIILRGVLAIKGENGSLKEGILEIKRKNEELQKENSFLKNLIIELHNPNNAPPEIPEGWRVYRFLELGFEIGYIEGSNISIEPSIEKSKSTNDGMRLKISLDEGKDLAVDAVNIKKYESINNYLNRFYKGRLYVKKSMYINNEKFDLYKMSGEKYYHFILKNQNYIFDINSPSEELLIKTIGTFKFI